jgi:hypothetical protein
MELNLNIESKKVNYKNREDFLINLKKNIENLHVNEQIEILDMMIKENVNISENNNGSFVNISSIDDAFLFKIYNFVEIRIKQKQLFNSVEDEKERIKNEYMK